MTLRLSLALVSLITAAGASTAAMAFESHEVTGRCLVGVNKEFQTIQSALDFPNPALGESGTPCVYVQPDAVVWREQLVIRRSVTLAGSTFRQGDTVFTTTLEPPANAVGPVALVRIEGRKVRVKVKHFIFQGPLTSGDGLIGIDAGKDTRLTIRDAFFLNIQPTPLDGRSGFIGIRTGAPTVPGERPQISFADISAVRFEGFQNSAMVFQGAGTIGVIYRTFVSAGPAARTAGQAAPVGILVKDGAVAEITRNDVVDVRGPQGAGGGVGIALDHAGTDTTLTENNIDRNNLGVAVDGTSASVLYRNGLDQNGAGIILGAVAPVTDITVSRNRVEAGGAGIRLVAGTENVIQTNHMLGNTGVGLAVGAATSKNFISKNRAHNNGDFGFADPTTGPDRSGTANFWRANL
jgi:parallel beta-helix repeat protein